MKKPPAEQRGILFVVLDLSINHNKVRHTRKPYTFK